MSFAGGATSSSPARRRLVPRLSPAVKGATGPSDAAIGFGQGDVMTATGFRSVAGIDDPGLSPRAYIEAHRQRRHSNRVLHGHPAPLFWKNSDISVPAIMAARGEDLRDTPKRLNLYVATPYCLPTNPDRCGFCLFPSEVYQARPQLDRYLGYLEREGEMYRPFLEGAPLTSVYFGGGTSNLYRADQYAR